MPIQFPIPPRDNPFDRVQWQRGARVPQQQVNPNLGRVGVPFSASTLNPGHGRGVRVPVNVRNLGKQYQATLPARVNPAPTNAPKCCIWDGVVMKMNARALAPTIWVLSGVSRDGTGATLASCQVLVFSTVNKEFIAETTSDGSGNWSVYVTRGWPFFLVEYKAGSPDVAGTSVNTIAPAVL